MNEMLENADSMGGLQSAFDAFVIGKKDPDEQRHLKNSELSDFIIDYAIYAQRQKDREKTMASMDGGKGGIDFRAVPIVIQPGTGIGVPPIDMKQLQLLAETSAIKDLDAEWANIREQMRGRQMPYAKMKEYVAVCCQRKAQDKHMDDVMACVTNILKLEEKCAVATSPEMKELLVMIEAGSAG